MSRRQLTEKGRVALLRGLLKEVPLSVAVGVHDSSTIKDTDDWLAYGTMIQPTSTNNTGWYYLTANWWQFNLLTYSSYSTVSVSSIQTLTWSNRGTNPNPLAVTGYLAADEYLGTLYWVELFDSPWSLLPDDTAQAFTGLEIGSPTPFDGLFWTQEGLLALAQAMFQQTEHQFLVFPYINAPTLSSVLNLADLDSSFDLLNLDADSSPQVLLSPANWGNPSGSPLTTCSYPSLTWTFQGSESVTVYGYAVFIRTSQGDQLAWVDPLPSPMTVFQNQTITLTPRLVMG
jgi:hypothetical protein